MNDHDEDFEYDDDFPESMDLFEYDEELDFDQLDIDWGALTEEV